MKKIQPLSVFAVILFFGLVGLVLNPASSVRAADDLAVIGLNYPETGPYAKQGLDQRRAAEMALEEINTAGGILGKKVKLAYRDTKSNAKVAKENAVELFDNEGAQMMLGGSSSAVAIASGKVAKDKKKIFFGTLT